MRRIYMIAVAALALASAATAHDIGNVNYLGNEGILVAKGDTKILFDAFYAESFNGEYTLVPASMEQAMMEGRRPYDGIDAIFVSHIHPDHFNSRKVIAYLRAHPDVQLYAGLDVVGAIGAADVSVSDPIRKRITLVHVARGEGPLRYTIDGVEVEAYAIPHNGNGPMPHYAFRVTLDGAATVIHLGDSDANEDHFSPYQAQFDQKVTHMAFAPEWMLTSEAGKRILHQRIRPKKVLGIHVPEKGGHPNQSRRETGVDLFTEPGESRPLPHDHK